MKTTVFNFFGLKSLLSITAIAIGACSVFAQPQQTTAKTQNIQGRITELTKNDHNDVDGWVLENGEKVHLPPHAFTQLENDVKVGATVKATTINKRRPDGTSVNEAVIVDVNDQSVAILPPSPPSRPAPPNPKNPPHSEESQMKAKGKILSFHKNKHGDVDGFALSDNTEVKFPPHLGESLTEDLKVGTLVDVHGRRHETPKGDIHLHAETILADGYSYTIDAPKPPEHGPPHRDWMTKKQADDMLTELRAIRQLLEKRSADE